MTISSGPGQGHSRYILPLSEISSLKILKKFLHCFAVRVRSGHKRVSHRNDLLRLVSLKILKLATDSDHFKMGQSCEPGASLFVRILDIIPYSMI